MAKGMLMMLGKPSKDEEDDDQQSCRAALMDAVKAIKSGDTEAAVAALEAAIDIKLSEG